jgi:hypothetical protein
MAKRKDPMVDRDERAVGDPALNQALTQSRTPELTVGDHSILLLRKAPKHQCRRPSLRMRIKFSSYFIENLIRIGAGRHDIHPDGRAQTDGARFVKSSPRVCKRQARLGNGARITF